MTTPLGIVSDTSRIAYFLSDVHLGGSPEPDECVKRERLRALLDRVASESASLYILGDLFDFWFEYKTVIPRVAHGILARIEALAEQGTHVRYLGGNHDAWLCDFLDRETRIEILEDGCVVEIQGRKLCLFHGDGRGPGDTGYKILKRIVRNPLAIRAFRWVHPDLGIPLALGSSGVSRQYTAQKPVDVEALYEAAALPELQKGVDAVLMGHHHVPIHWNREDGEFLILGDWFRNYTCARLENGKIELARWPLEESKR